MGVPEAPSEVWEEISINENTPPRELPGDKGVAGVSGLEKRLLPGEVGLSHPEESDWNGDGIWSCGRSSILNRQGGASDSSSEEEYSNENNC